MVKKLGRVIAIISISIVSIILIGGIVASLIDSDKANNTVTVGGNRIEIIEDFSPPEKLEPGVEFKKDVSVKNVGLSDCYVRIKAVFTDSDMEKYCVVDWNTDDFEYNANDNFYYYKKELKQGEITESIFKKVIIKTTYDSDGDGIEENISTDEMKDFDILVYAESYQSRGFNNYTEAWKHYKRNKPVD